MEIPEGLTIITYQGREATPASDLSRVMGKSEGAIRASLHAGALEGVQIGRGWFVYLDSLARWEPRVGRPRKEGQEEALR